jgi:sulfur carrier protein
VQVTVNGEATDVPAATTVAALVAERSAGHSRVAVAVNGGVVPRSAWETTTLTAGDAVEVLAPTAGG